jgi:hypothetical protein
MRPRPRLLSWATLLCPFGVKTATRGLADLDLIRREWSATADEKDRRTMWLEAEIAKATAPRFTVEQCLRGPR